MDPSRNKDSLRLSGVDGFWEPVRSNVVDCFSQFFDYVLPREPLAVVRVVAYCLRERLAWCHADGTPRAPREVVTLDELYAELSLDRKSVRAALERAVQAHYLEAVIAEDGATGFRLKLDLTHFSLEESDFRGFYPLPTHRVRVPLEFFTTVVVEETLATIKVVACIIRLTLGSVDNLGQPEVQPAISQQQFVRRMNMGRRQAIWGVQAALTRGYIRRLEQGSLETGRPSTYGLYWRKAPQAMSWPEKTESALQVVSLGQALGKRDQGAQGKRDQEAGKKGSGDAEKGIRGQGKRDQGAGKKGSGAADRIDLLKDLRSRSQISTAASSTQFPDAFPGDSPTAPAAAAAELFERVRSQFPLGNPHLIGRFVAERGAFLGEILDAMGEVDPAFVRRFTRSADPRWAAFHTCAEQGILPPRRPPEPTQASLFADDGRAREERAWRQKPGAERSAELVELWRRTCRLYLGEVLGDEAEVELRHEIARRLEAGEEREVIEQWVFADIARRRGKPIGPIGAG